MLLKFGVQSTQRTQSSNSRRMSSKVSTSTATFDQRPVRSTCPSPSFASRSHRKCRRCGRPTVQVKAASLSESNHINLAQIREGFPILRQNVHEGKRLVYLDNAATSQKPAEVLSAMDEYYNEYNSNVHRGVHALSARATDRYEEAREKVAKFIGADTSREIVFTRNASEAINLVAYTWGLQNLKEGDEVVLSVAEHHSNIVPWQIISKQTKCSLKYVYLDAETQTLDMNHFEEVLSDRTKLVTIGHVSNVLGCVNPVKEMVALAKQRNPEAKVLLDACQSVPHMPVNFKDLQVDFAVCSGHKMCAPTGIGFLWGKMEILESMPPFMGGGEMIQDVYEDSSTYAKPPGKFEAGTPAICEAIGLGAACDYLSDIGMENLERFEHEMGTYMYNELVKKIEGIEIYGPDPNHFERAALAAFNVEGLHATDVSMILDQYGIAIRSGHHCTQPLHHYLGINASARASLYIYNTKDEIDEFVLKLKDTIDFFRGI